MSGKSSGAMAGGCIELRRRQNAMGLQLCCGGGRRTLKEFQLEGKEVGLSKFSYLQARHCGWVVIDVEVGRGLKSA